MQLVSNPVRPSELLDLAEIAIATDRFLFIEGQGGAGKTSIVSGILAPRLGRRLYYVNLNGQGPQEVIGYGKPDGKEMDFYAPTIWPTRDRVGDEPILLFLDEVPDYDPAVRALLRSLYPATGDRYAGPHKLGTNVFVVIAGNRRQDGTKAAVEDAPLTERCIKVTIQPTVEDWLDWYDTKAKLVDTGSHVPTFLKFGISCPDGREHFNPPIVMPYDGKPHPCPRTWEAVALAEPFRKTKPAAYRHAVVGSIGEAAANAYFGFLQHVDKLPDIVSLRANPDAFNVPSDPAAQFALVSACLNTGTRGITDIPAAVHSGGFDWLVSLLLRCRGDIREYGAMAAVRRGIPLDEHPRSRELVLTA